MMTFFHSVQTSTGQVSVLTKTHWWGIIPKPHTNILPREFSKLGSLGVVINWSTNDPGTLKEMHDYIVRAVKEFGLDGIRESASLQTNKISGYAHVKELLPAQCHPHVAKVW